jgi:16S rRNA (guanine966-N2)-methyltransferase
VLDAFAGTGALGLEALSRGARRVVFIESSASVLTVLRANAGSLGALGSCEIVRADAVGALASGVVRGPFELILADPPYDSTQADRFLEAVDGQASLTPGGLRTSAFL